MKTDKKTITSIELKIQGLIGNVPVTIKNYDISDLIELLEDSETLIRKPLNKDCSKDNITVSYEEGSVKLVIFATVFAINSLFADLNEATVSKSLINVDRNRADIISKWQQKVKANKDLTFTISDSVNVLKIKIDKDSDFILPSPQFVDVEIILYGEIFDMGGKDNPNIHIDTENGVLKASCKKNDIIAEHRLYSTCGIRVKAKQDISTMEISKEGMQFIEFINYKGKLEGDNLLKFIKDGTEAWKDIDDSVKWQRKIRGYED